MTLARSMLVTAGCAAALAARAAPARAGGARPATPATPAPATPATPAPAAAPTAAPTGAPTGADDARARFAAGRRLLMRREYARAIAELEAAQRLEPRAEQLYALAVAYQLSGAPAKAISAYHAYVAIAPDGKHAADATRDAAALAAAAAADQAAAAEIARAGAQGHAGSARLRDAQARLDAAAAKVKGLEKQRDDHAAARDAAAAEAARAHEAVRAAEADLRAWRGVSLAAPSGGGRGRRVLGALLVAGGTSALAAGTWYGLDARDASSQVSSATAWTTGLDDLVARGQRGDDRIRVLLPVGAVAVLAGGLVLGWGEHASTTVRPPAELVRRVEGGGP